MSGTLPFDPELHLCYTATLRRSIFLGSWNKTCGLSNLHITSGTEVYVFVLEENTDKTDRCYSTAFWKPLLLPFTSKYNDYGGGEESSGAGFQLIMDSIANKLVEQELGENVYHDIAVKKEGFGEEQFFESVHENRLFMRAYNGAGPIIDYVMLRKDIVDNILETRVIEQYVGEGKGTGGWSNCYIYYKFEDILKDLPEFMDELTKKLTPPIGSDTDMVLHNMIIQMMHGFENIFEYKHPNKIGKWVRGDSHRFSSIVRVSELVTGLIEAGKRTEADLLMIDYLKGQYVNEFMEATRKNWAPGGHEGSQNQNVKEYRTLMSAITTVLDAEQSEWDDENGDED